MKSLNRRSLAALGIAGVLAAGAAIPALAQDETETPEVTEDTTLGELREMHEERAAERQTAFAERLAAELGLDTATVDEAMTTVREEMQAERRAEMLARLQERLDQAVADGELTQEEADERLEAAENGELRGGFGGRGGHGRGGHGGFGPGGFGPGGDLDASTDAEVETSSI